MTPWFHGTARNNRGEIDLTALREVDSSQRPLEEPPTSSSFEARTSARRHDSVCCLHDRTDATALPPNASKGVRLSQHEFSTEGFGPILSSGGIACLLGYLPIKRIHAEAPGSKTRVREWLHHTPPRRRHPDQRRKPPAARTCRLHSGACQSPRAGRAAARKATEP